MEELIKLLEKNMMDHIRHNVPSGPITAWDHKLVKLCAESAAADIIAARFKE